VRQPTKLALVIAATLVLAGLTTWQVEGINGPSFWKWGLRQLSPLRTYLALLAAAVPFALAQWGTLRRWRHRSCLLALMLAVLTLELTALGIGKTPFSLDRIPEFIRRPLYTSYFKDAETVQELRPWLREFPERLSGFRVHSQNKPPGPILFFKLCRWIAPEPNRAAWLSGLAIAVLATLAVPATYLLTRRLTRDPEAAFAAASCMALSPGLLLFLPCLDQLFPVLAALLVLTWHRALEGSNAAAAGFGLALAGTLFVTYNLLVLGIFLGLLTLLPFRRGTAQRVGLALATLAGAYLALYLATGYDPIASFQAALANQSRLAEIWQRPYPRTIPWDLYDFLLGTGWIGGLLAAFYLVSKARREEPERWRLALFAVLQIAGVALTGLLRTETARVWLFLQPLFFLVVGLELRTWTWRQRQVVYFGLWLLTATICRNLRFL
jgi:hypothetical protein